MTTSKVLLGVAFGVAAGAALGILLAPDSGANTRKMITDKSQTLANDVKGKWNHIVEGFNHRIEDVKEGIHNRIGEVKEDAHDFAERAKSKLSDPVRKMASGNTPT